MAKRIPVALVVYAVLVAMFLAGASSPIQAGSGNSAAYAPDQIITRFADDVGAQAQADANARSGGQEIQDLGGVGAKVVRVATGSVERALRAYLSESGVRYAEPNYIVHAIGPVGRPLGAPGQDVLSTTRNNSYSYFSGTSMATPHVSGAAALVLSQSPTMSVATIRSRAFSGRTVSGERLNLCKAIVGCGGPPPAPDCWLSVSPASATVTRGASAS